MGFDEYNARNRGRAAAPYVSKYGADQIESFGQAMAASLEEIDKINDRVFAVATVLTDVVIAGAVATNPELAPVGALATEVLDGLKDATDGDGKFDKSRIARILEKAAALNAKDDAPSSDSAPANPETPHASK